MGRLRGQTMSATDADQAVQPGEAVAKGPIAYFAENRVAANLIMLVLLVGGVIAGTGLGHVNKPVYPALKRVIEAGVHVVMTVQTLWGYAQMYVYDTGRDLLDLGVIPLDNMLPETALMKLGWVLGHTDDRDEVQRSCGG